ncbi:MULTISPECIES: carbon-nitrogen hydrolase family protein [Pseudomonas]|jgi:predicted amidohydrolase|uniref:Carbon-nitrogen hydrolase family protein n=1 Tax=Pseudomonas yamanorum TaxID=515393 RepID=A0A7Y8JS38_9PSED|nr:MULTISPECIES: carbon-nitrogen hydrolase family protein [Pseudomonas]MCS3414850.1 putative amidohydrolase [Pseudomonas sp. BIGb0558]MCS3438671.1 putative amidohydrolase [Pseudomonas sp. BIGb0450]NVZ80848.1 carbon-nitrogen hydrolase family protein [Pseudomonas yamanorum]NWD25049.1 carbon-nitrogen hydrolase family protein [Pseudomonas yamanorum]NWE16155.1 carbon-nitrogen hydrolase family protein [Pseudomonas yamanorum]
MRVALYQCPPLPLDVAGNLKRLHQLAQEANDADLLVLPEMFLTGYNIGMEAVGALAEAQDGPSAQSIAALAKNSGVAILYGYPERGADGQIYNAVQLIDANGQRLCNYRKTHLFGDLDHSMFSAGDDDFPLVELNGWKLGFLICYDLEFPENTRRLALAGAELILVPTANMVPFDFVADVTVRARAFENQCYVAYANYCGQEGEIQYCGQSSIAAPDGQRIAQAGLDEALIVGTLDRQLMVDSRAANRYLLDRRPELYGALHKH